MDPVQPTNRFLVHADTVRGPASHAVVIGVSTYPHLLGGTGTLTSKHEGMGQLTSPAPSAREFASWLVRELRDPHKPLATVAMLLSEPAARAFHNPRTGTDHEVESATMANTRQALREWASRARTGDDRLILYFCGHGLANGTNASLLLTDYGADPYDVLGGAIDFSNLWLGMEVVAAREQCFFIDACRVNAQTTIGANGYMGQPIFAPSVETYVLPPPPPRQAPIYYSTLLGAAAYARLGLPTPFTDALIRALDGAGSDDNEGDWRVTTTGLKRALDFFMERAFQQGARRVQVPAANNLTTFDLHFLSSEPEALVFVGCRPEEATALASFSSLLRGEVVGSRDPSPGEWELRLRPGSYEFVAEFADSAFPRTSRERYVGPPYRKVPLEVHR